MQILINNKNTFFSGLAYHQAIKPACFLTNQAAFSSRRKKKRRTNEKLIRINRPTSDNWLYLLNSKYVNRKGLIEEVKELIRSTMKRGKLIGMGQANFVKEVPLTEQMRKEQIGERWLLKIPISPNKQSLDGNKYWYLPSSSTKLAGLPEVEYGPFAFLRWVPGYPIGIGNLWGRAKRDPNNPRRVIVGNRFSQKAVPLIQKSTMGLRNIPERAYRRLASDVAQIAEDGGLIDNSSGNLIVHNSGPVDKQRIFVIDTRTPKQAKGAKWTNNDVTTVLSMLFESRFVGRMMDPNEDRGPNLAKSNRLGLMAPRIVLARRRILSGMLIGSHLPLETPKQTALPLYLGPTTHEYDHFQTPEFLLSLCRIRPEAWGKVSDALAMMREYARDYPKGSNDRKEGIEMIVQGVKDILKSHEEPLK